MSMSETAIAGLEFTLNRYLAMDPLAMERLAGLHGQVICIEIPRLGLRLYMVPGATGIQVFDRFEGEPDCTLRGTPLALARMSSSQASADQLFAGSVEIRGDTELGHQFGELLGNLDIDWEEQLSYFAGDPLAHEIGKGVRALTHWGKQTLSSWGMNLQEYLQEELRLLPTRVEIEGFLSDVDRFRDDVERMQARVSRLRQQLDRSHNPGSGN